ncbi:MAG: hypothetical protein WAN50_04035 [Minisyncoccia bacterium]
MAKTSENAGKKSGSKKSAKTLKPLIGFIGNGFIGRNYSDDFERRGYTVIRYSLEEPYRSNKEKIRNCDIVFIAVPTPTTPKGFDCSIVREAVGLAGNGKIVVIKSTLQPGSTEELQKKYPDRLVMHSPEFLREATAAYDASHPERNIVGIPTDTKKYRDAAHTVISVLPKAPYELVCKAREAEHIKQAGNAFFYFKVIFANLIHDVAEADGCDWEVLSNALAADSRIGRSHLKVKHESRPGEKPGRGAGGHCLIKDFAVLRALYGKRLPKDTYGQAVFRAVEEKNKHLLVENKKDLDLLQNVYGPLSTWYGKK